jgi:hypothetical protein
VTKPLPTKPGINGANVLSIPTEWDATWFRKFINNSLKGADVRNAIAGPGITISGTIASPYATISATGAGGGVSQITAGTGISISPAGGTGNVTVTNAGVTSIVAGTGITISGATGAVTITNTGPVALVPATIPDLTNWFASDNINVTAATGQISRLLDRNPWSAGVFAFNATGTATISSTPLNGLPILNWGGSSGYPMQAGYEFPVACTIFAVIRPATTTGGQAILGCTVSAGISFYLEAASGSGKIAIVKSGTSTIGTATNAWSPGAAFQCNVTYVASSGAFAFRQGRAANGSGTGTVGAGPGVATNLFAADSNTGTAPLAANTGVAEVIVYARQLTGTEITAVENYIFAKWGV